MSSSSGVLNRSSSSSLSGPGSTKIEGVEESLSSSSDTQKAQPGDNLVQGGVTAKQEAYAKKPQVYSESAVRIRIFFDDLDVDVIEEGKKRVKDDKGKEPDYSHKAKQQVHRTKAQKASVTSGHAEVEAEKPVIVVDPRAGLPKFKPSGALNSENMPKWLKDLGETPRTVALLAHNAKRSTAMPEFRYYTEEAFPVMVDKFAAEQRDYLQTDLTDKDTQRRLGGQLAVILGLREEAGGAVSESMQQARHDAGVAVYKPAVLSNFVSAMTSFVPGFSVTMAGLFVSNPVVLGSVAAAATLGSGYVLTKLPGWQTTWHVRGVKERDFKLFPFAAPGVESRKYIDQNNVTRPLRAMRDIEKELGYLTKLQEELTPMVSNSVDQDLVTVKFKNRIAAMMDEIELVDSKIKDRQHEIISADGGLAPQEKGRCRELIRKERKAAERGETLPANEKKELNKLLSAACTAIGATDFLDLLHLDVERQFLQSIFVAYSKDVTPQAFLDHVKYLKKDRRIQKRVHKANKKINHGQLAVESRQVRGGLNFIASAGSAIASGGALGDVLHGTAHTFTTFGFDPKALNVATNSVTLGQTGVYGATSMAGAEEDMTARITALTEMLVLMGPANLYFDRATKQMADSVQPNNLNFLTTSAPEVRIKGITKCMEVNAQVAAAKLSTWTLPPPGEEPPKQRPVTAEGTVVRYDVESHIQVFSACKTAADAKKNFRLLTVGRKFTETEMKAVDELIEDLVAWNKLKTAVAAYDLEALLADPRNLLTEKTKKIFYFSIKHAMRTVENQVALRNGESPKPMPQEYIEADQQLAWMLADIDLAMLASWEEYAQKFGMQFLWGLGGPGSVQAAKLPFTGAAGIATAVGAPAVSAALNIIGNIISAAGSLFSVGIAAQQDAHTALKLVHLNRNEELNLPSIVHTGVNEEFNDRDAREMYGHVDPARFKYFGSTRPANEAIGPGAYEVPQPVSLFDDCVEQVFAPRLDPQHYFGGFAKSNANVDDKIVQNELLVAQRKLEIKQWRAQEEAARAKAQAPKDEYELLSDSDEGISGDVDESDDSDGVSDDEGSNITRKKQTGGADVSSDEGVSSSDEDENDSVFDQNANLANIPVTLNSRDPSQRIPALEEVRKLGRDNRSEGDYAQFCEQLQNISPVAAWGMLARWGNSNQYDTVRHDGLTQAMDSLNLGRHARDFLYEVAATTVQRILSDEVGRTMRGLVNNGTSDEIATVAEMLMVGSFGNHCRDLLESWRPESEDMAQRKAVLLQALDRG